MTVRVHFIDGTERIVPAKNIRPVGEEGARSATALVDGKEIPIYNRPDWNFTWYEQQRESTPPPFAQIIEGLFEIAAPGAIKNALWARYQELLAEEPTDRPDTPESDDEEEARAEAYWRKSEQQEDEVQE